MVNLSSANSSSGKIRRIGRFQIHEWKNLGRTFWNFLMSWYFSGYIQSWKKYLLKGEFYVKFYLHFIPNLSLQFSGLATNFPFSPISISCTETWLSYHMVPFSFISMAYGCFSFDWLIYWLFHFLFPFPRS